MGCLIGSSEVIGPTFWMVCAYLTIHPFSTHSNQMGTILECNRKAYHEELQEPFRASSNASIATLCSLGALLAAHCRFSSLRVFLNSSACFCAFFLPSLSVSCFMPSANS